MTISELRDGNRIYGGQYLIADVKKGVTTTSKRYLTILFQDSTGTMEAKLWDFDPQEEATFEKGAVVTIDAEVISYRDALQMKVFNGTKANMDSIDWSRFVPSAPVAPSVLKEKLNLYVEAIEDEDLRAVVNAMVAFYGERYLTYPAAVRNHHNYVAGLLYHSITMADLACKVCKVYPALSRDMVLAGTIIHDMGKTVELSGCQATQFTLEGKLLGHISIGQAELRAQCKKLGMFAYDELKGDEPESVKQALFEKKEKAICLEHIILSHHTKPEFGSPVPPLTRDALAVAMIDDMDAKMMILDKAFVGVEKGGYTGKMLTMDDRYFYRPFYSKEMDRPSGTSVEEEKADLHR